MARNRWAGGLLAMALATISWCEAHALSGPYHGYVRIFALGGSTVSTGNLENPINTVTNIQADEGVDDTGPVSLAGGANWFCLPGNPNCSITFASNASLGWAESSSDPVAGVIETRTGAFHVDGGPVPPRCVEFLGMQICQPVGEWGTALSEGVVRQAFEVHAPGLEPGTPVQVRADLSLAGMFTDDLFSGIGTMTPTTSVAAALLLSRYDPLDPAPFLEEDYTPWSGIEDILGTPELRALLLDWILVETDSVTVEDVAVDQSITVTVEVGDVVVMDLGMETVAVLKNDDEGREAWAEFADTLTGSLVATTPGVVLVPLPEPDSGVLGAAVLTALAGLAARRRR